MPNRKINFSFEDYTDHEHRAGIICALTALTVASDDYVAVGDPLYGDIALPSLKHWGISDTTNNPWMEDALWENIIRVRANRRNHPNHTAARVVRGGQWMP